MSPEPLEPIVSGRGEGTRVKGGEIQRRVKMWVSINIFKAVSKSFLVEQL